MKQPPFKLVPDRISHDTVNAVEQLHALAMAEQRRQQRLIGLAFVGMTMGPKGRHYFTNAAGELYRAPAVARGYVATLDDALGQLARGEVPFGWEP
jgi:hypothetical protein